MKDEKKTKKELIDELVELRRHVSKMGKSETDSKKTKKSLRKSEEWFRAIFSNTPDHILMQDNELRNLLVVNPHLGLTEKDIIA